MIELELLIPAGIIITAVGYGAYKLYRGESGSLDLDDDPEPEVEVTEEGGIKLDVGDQVEEVAEEVEDGEDYVSGKSPSTNPTMDHLPDSFVVGDDTGAPVPKKVFEKDGLADIKGIGETRAKGLADAGFSRPTDLYYAKDEKLIGVYGIGGRAIEQIREDIGSVTDDE